MQIFDKQSDTAVPRRRFLKVGIAALNGFIAFALAIPGLGYLLTPVLRRSDGAWIPLGNASSLQSAEPRKASFKYTTTEGYSRNEKNGFAWVVTDTEEASGISAFSAVCSHTGCNVTWQSRENHFVCPCHDGRYDRRGAVVSGPPPRPLSKLALKMENGQVFVRLPS